jgi:hypothetical protein
MNAYYYYLIIAGYLILGIICAVIIYWLIRALKAVVNIEKELKNISNCLERREKREEERSIRRI